jgi:hypothetical protein
MNKIVINVSNKKNEKTCEGGQDHELNKMESLERNGYVF